MMKGLIARALCGAGLMAGAVGCYGYADLVDPCYPDRYNMMARQEVIAAAAPQVYNGHVLDQTVWNHDFEPGSDKLTSGGLENLGRIARRRPCPDPAVYVQTAQDVSYDPADTEAYVKARRDLDEKRRQAVQRYLVAYTTGSNRPLDFQVLVHDPGPVGMAAQPMGISVQKMYAASVGALPVGSGAGASNVAGGGGAR